MFLRGVDIPMHTMSEEVGLVVVQRLDITVIWIFDKNVVSILN